MQEILDSLSPIERKIIPHLGLSIEEISNKTGLDLTSVLRALKFLENKGLVKINSEKKELIELGVNGVYYKKNHLPERNLLQLVETKRQLSLQEAKTLSRLSDNEFKVSLGVLKRKNLVEIKNGRLVLSAGKEDPSNKFPEEEFLELLPLEKEKLDSKQIQTFKELKARKDIVEVVEKKIFGYEITPSGKNIAGKEIKSNLLEEVNSEIIKSGTKGRKFRKYDILAPVPRISGGKKHFVNQSINYARRIWLEMGFKEMSGEKTVTSFWNFDALFTAQDHPVRDMHDTFFIKGLSGKLPEKELVERVRKAHEKGISGSKGWQYDWKESEAKKVLIRTHTTCLSAKTLSKIKKENMPAKYFGIGKNFRNETVDWSHGFEFNQTEGIVVDPNANLRNLIGYLKEFAKKMGFEKIRIQPAYFPYTEPSLEGAVWNPEKKAWVEVIAAGIFRPEVTAALIGEPVPVLAWGPGFDRLMMMAYEIKDMRELYQNNLKQLRGIKYWSK